MNKDFIEKTNWLLDLIDNPKMTEKEITKKEYEEGIKEFNKFFKKKENSKYKNKKEGH